MKETLMSNYTILEHSDNKNESKDEVDLNVLLLQHSLNNPKDTLAIIFFLSVYISINKGLSRLFLFSRIVFTKTLFEYNKKKKYYSG